MINYLNTILKIIDAIWILAKYKWNNGYDAEYENRKIICNSCLLNINGICSNKYYINIRNYGNKKKYTLIINKDRYKEISNFIGEIDNYFKRGCGCILFLKQILLDEKCPTNKW